MRSDDHPDVVLESNECCNAAKLKQHIRTMQTSLRWLEKENKLRREKTRLETERKAKAEKQQKAATHA
jgi:hypothetical protein